MKQYKFIAPGSQTSNSRVLAHSPDGKFFGMCSANAICIYNSDFMMVREIPTEGLKISSFLWSPHNQNILATSCFDNKSITIWDLPSGQAVCNHSWKNISRNPIAMDWHPTDESIIAVACDDCTVMTFDFADMTSPSMTHLLCRPGIKPSALKWSPSSSDLLVVGNEDGSLTLFNRSTKKENKISISEEATSAIIDLQWDPLSDSYLLVAMKNGDISLWDVGSNSLLHVFERQGAGLCGINWLEWAPGSFCSANSRSGVVRIWNVSQKQPLKLLRVCGTGFAAFRIVANTTMGICTFIDGSVRAYDLQSEQLLFESLPGHNMTIYDCKFHPKNHKEFVTCSGDGNVKIWNHENMRCELSLFQGGLGSCMSVDWEPKDGKYLAAGYKSGDVIIWDSVKGMVTNKIRHHAKMVTCVMFHPKKHDLMISGAADGCAILFDWNDRGSPILQTLRHPGAVTGCRFHPSRNFVATACKDGGVRVWDLNEFAKKSTNVLKKPTYIIKEHHRYKAMSVCLRWNPFNESLLASSSDDKSIVISDPFENNIVQKLVGHTSPVRGIIWHPEMKNVLLSVGWDSTVRVWDAERGTCLSILRGHSADLYGIDIHRSRPFSVITAGKDCTIRFWRMEGFMRKRKSRAMFCHNIEGLIEDSISHNPLGCLNGKRSQEIVNVWRSDATSFDKLKSLSDFFLAANGLHQTWALVKECSKKGVSDPLLPLELSLALDIANAQLGLQTGHLSKIHAPDPSEVYSEACCLHKDVVLQAHEKFGEELCRKRMGLCSTPGIPNKEQDRLELAASIFLEIGNLKRYCEILYQLGKHDEALACAPAVSLEFWKELSLKHANDLEDQDNEIAAAHYSATGEIDKEIEFLMGRKQNNEAFSVASAKSSLKKILEKKEKTTTIASKPTKSLASEEEEVDEKPMIEDTNKTLINEVSLKRAQYHLTRGNPISAANVMLADDNCDSCIEILLNSNEVELAFLIGQLLPLSKNIQKTLLIRAAERMEWCGAHNNALALIRKAEALNIGEPAESDAGEDISSKIKSHWLSGLLTVRFSGAGSMSSADAVIPEPPEGLCVSTFMCCHVGSEAITTFWEKAGLPKKESLLAQGRLLVSSLNEENALTEESLIKLRELVWCFVVAGNTDDAINAVVDHIIKPIQKECDPLQADDLKNETIEELETKWKLPLIDGIIEPLLSVQASLLNPASKSKLLAICHFFCGLKALRQGKSFTCAGMLRAILRLAITGDLIPFKHKILYRVLLRTIDVLRIQHCQSYAALLSEMLGSWYSDGSGRVYHQVNLHNTLVEEAEDEEESPTNTSAVTIGSKIPCKALATPCIITGQPLKGEVCCLMDCDAFASMSEMVTWSLFNPFSPSNTGWRLATF